MLTWSPHIFPLLFNNIQDAEFRQTLARTPFIFVIFLSPVFTTNIVSFQLEAWILEPLGEKQRREETLHLCPGALSLLLVKNHLPGKGSLSSHQLNLGFFFLLQSLAEPLLRAPQKCWRDPTQKAVIQVLRQVLLADQEKGNSHFLPDFIRSSFFSKLLGACVLFPESLAKDHSLTLPFPFLLVIFTHEFSTHQL